MVPDYREAVLEVKDLEAFNNKYNDFINKYDYPIEIKHSDGKVRVSAKGISSHGSTPEKGENAISYLMMFLEGLFSEKTSLGEFIKIYNERIGFYHYGEKIGCGFEDKTSGKLNFNPGVIKIEDEKIILTINIRYPISNTGEEVYNGIRENLKDTSIKLVEGESEQKPLYISKDNFLVKKLMEVYREETGDKDSKPITIGEEPMQGQWIML